MGKEHGVQLGSAAAHVEPDHDFARRMNNMGPGGSFGVYWLSKLGEWSGWGSAKGHAQIQNEAKESAAQQVVVAVGLGALYALVAKFARRSGKVLKEAETQADKAAAATVARLSAPNPAWRQSAPNRRTLAGNLGIQRGSGLDAHHIVAGKLEKAQPARDILDRYQIDINSAENGVPLVGGKGAPKQVLPRRHRGNGLHSKEGLDAVNKRLSIAIRGIDDWAKARQAVLDELALIRTEIELGTFP